MLSSPWKKAKVEYKGKFVWTTPDLPPDERFPRAIVFAGRKLCTEWGYQWNQIYVDEADPLKPILKVDDEDIITTWTTEEEIKVSIKDGWAQYFDAKNFKATIDTATEKFQASKRMKNQRKR